jgi:HK97 gp10 family phage protein
MSKDFNNWDEIAEKFDTAISAVVRKAAFDVQAKAQARVPVDTGFLKNSIYTITSNRGLFTSTKDEQGNRIAKTGARSTRRRVKKSLQDQLFPEIAPPASDQEAYVVVGARYGLYVEMGTRRMPARPYFYPSLEEVRASFDEALSKIEDKLKEVRGE